MSRRSKKTGYTDFQVVNKSETSDLLPWPEWSDIELNAEQWSYPKASSFIDPRGIKMPRSLPTVNEWKRFAELNSVAAPVLYEATLNPPDFTTNNDHLMQSEFVRSFLSTLANLRYCGRNGLEVENPMNNFSWNLSDQQWQGWFNVYSLNKAGKGAAHRPVFNPSGKYVTRIFHMGRWRRILVDDSVPVDQTGTPLLPRTSNLNELWPMILAKALLKVVALSWTVDREIVDCSLISCLTGWIDLSLDVSRFSSLNQWELITKYTKHFEWARDESSSTDSKPVLPDKLISRKSKTRLTKLEDVSEDQEPTKLFLTLEESKSANGPKIPDGTVSQSHQIYVEMSRDVPLDPTKQARAPLAKWKNYRWLDWSIRTGLVDAAEYFVPLRRLLVVSPMAWISSNQEDGVNEDFMEELGIVSTSRSSKTMDDERPDVPDASLKTSGIDEPKKHESRVWADFNRLSRYLREIHLFYRRKFFECNAEIGRIAAQFTTDNERAIFIRNDSKRLLESRESPVNDGRAVNEYHEQIYLFVDSVDEKFFLVNLSTSPWKYNPADDNTDDVAALSSVAFETHDIFDQRYLGHEHVESLRTRGSNSIVFGLPPGRHLLRILTNFPMNANAAILSDTPFNIGDLASMHELMIVEASRIDRFARAIATSVIRAFEAFGTTDYTIQLKNYYRSYAPDATKKTTSSEHRSHRKRFKFVHETFSEEFFKFIEKRFLPSDHGDVRRAMRIFFLDPSIGATTIRDEEKRNDPRIEEEKSSTIRNATIVQSFFRMALIKRYREIHDIHHPEHNRVKELLVKIGHVFHTEHGAHCVLRQVVERHPESPKILYSWLADLKHVIVIQELRGQITELNDQWIPLARINVNVAKNTTVLASIDLLTSLPRSAVRSFDNDSLCEMSRLVNNVIPNRYTYRENGYTVFAYGWTSEYAQNKGIDWCLRLTTIKGQPTFHSINRIFLFPPVIDVTPLQIRDFSNVYVPNLRGRLFRLIARVTSKTLVSLRLSASYDRVLTRLRVARQDGSVITEIEGGGNLIVPLILLEYEVPTSESPDTPSETRKSSNRKLRGSLSDRSGILTKRSFTEEVTVTKTTTNYTIEAFVREDSWPLTETEWIAVTEFTSYEDEQNRGTPKPSGSRRRSRHSSKKPLMEFVRYSVSQIMKTGPFLGLYLSRKMNSLGLISMLHIRLVSSLSDERREPHWSLRIVTDPESEIEVIRDTSEKELIEELQRLWNSQEPGRSERGRKSRRAYLDEISRASTSLSVTNLANATTSSNATESIEKMINLGSMADEGPKQSNLRTLEPPAHLPGHLPKLDLTIYMVKEDEEEDRWVKTEFDEETLRNQRAINVLDFEQLRSSLLEEFSQIMAARRKKYERIAQRYIENRENRNREFIEINEAKKAWIESMRPASESVKSKAASKSKKRS